MIKRKLTLKLSRGQVITSVLLKKKDKAKIERVKRVNSKFSFDWRSFDYRSYFLNEHLTFRKSREIQEPGYYLQRYGIKGRFYRVWTEAVSILRLKYADAVGVFNKVQVFPLQKIFAINDYFLIWDNSKWLKEGGQPITRPPFMSFNRWARSILSFYRPLRTIYEKRRNWLEFILLLNFKRHRFFPSIRSLNKPSFVSLSLGLFRRFTRRSRAWTKTRMSYLLSASFLRKVLIYTQFSSMYLFINRSPKHLTSILHTLQSPALQVYEYPFLNFKRDKRTKKFLHLNEGIQFDVPEPGSPLRRPVTEDLSLLQVQFPYILFTNSKAYAPTKKKKRGSIGRQNIKKIILLNRIAEYL
jgi:hypothetical protein